MRLNPALLPSSAIRIGQVTGSATLPPVGGFAGRNYSVNWTATSPFWTTLFLYSIMIEGASFLHLCDAFRFFISVAENNSGNVNPIPDVCL